ncbi:MAG: Ig-like domain repeat protein, partial [Armatimonadetes bacterium]|nr:Ig-like domain repeat protein [Armatimonadota bacterium]
TGHWHSMALKSDGTLWSWGRNVYRALGDGTSTDRHTPVQTLNLTNQTYIDAGGDFGLSVQAVVLNTAVTTKNVTMQYAKPTSLAATLLDQRGFPLLFQPLVFKIGNTTLSKGVRTSAAGVATLAIPNPSQFFVGQYTLKVNFAADRLYNASAASATLTITKADTKVSVGAFTVQPGQTKFLTATVRRTSDGAYLSNTPLTFKVDGMERGTSTTDGTGKASLSFTGDESLSAGAHALTVEYAGDGNHNASSGAGTLTIAQSPTYTTPSNVSGKVGSTITLKAKLIRTTDKALLVGRAIRFQIDGADVGTATTDATGFAMFSYTILAGTTKGDHPLTALFDGENLYANSSGGKTLTVK